MRKGHFPLQYIPDWFVTQQQVKIWHDDSDYHDKDRLVEWYDGYKKRRALKMQVEKELMPIAWHTSRWQVGAFEKTRKKRQKNYGHEYRILVSGDRIQKLFLTKKK